MAKAKRDESDKLKTLKKKLKKLKQAARGAEAPTKVKALSLIHI